MLACLGWQSQPWISIVALSDAQRDNPEVPSLYRVTEHSLQKTAWSNVTRVAHLLSTWIGMLCLDSCLPWEITVALRRDTRSSCWEYQIGLWAVLWRAGGVYCEVCGPVEQSLQEGAVSLYTHKHLRITVVAFSFTYAVSTEPTVHGKEEMWLSASPEPVILCPLQRSARRNWKVILKHGLPAGRGGGSLYSACLPGMMA